MDNQPTPTPNPNASSGDQPTVQAVEPQVIRPTNSPPPELDVSQTPSPVIDDAAVKNLATPQPITSIQQPIVSDHMNAQSVVDQHPTESTSQNGVSKKGNRKLLIIAVIVAALLLIVGAIIALAHKSNQSASNQSTSLNTHSTVSQSQLAANQATSQIKQQLGIIDSDLQQYASNNLGIYPSSLTDLVGEPGATPPITVSDITPPSGTKFKYTPTPSGCTTAAKNCTKFTLQATSSSGQVIETLTSDN